MISLVLFGSLFVLLILQVPVAFALGISSLLTIFYTNSLSITYIAQNLVTSLDSFPLMAVPFFVLAGELMGGGGISKRLLNTANIFFGKITGGMAIVTVVVCMFFAAISGSGPATVAAIGGMVIPTMLEKGYDRKFTLSVIAAAGSIGVIIPPSIPMVIYSVSTNSSVSKLFMAGFIPGILMGIALIGYSYFYSKKMKYYGTKEKINWAEAKKIIWDAKWALLSPVIILGGIYGGIFTPTEAAAVSVIYSFAVGVFVYKELTFKNLFYVVRNACLTTATIVVVIGCASAFTKVLTVARMPNLIAETIMGITSNKILILIFINLLLLFVGCFMDTLCSIMVLAPIFLPIVQAVGVDVTHFGIIMVVNLAIGFCTPPLGINLFVSSRIGGAPLTEVIKGIVPYIIVMVAVLLALTYIPAISLVLPNLFMK